MDLKAIGSIDDDLLAQIIKAAESKMTKPFAKKVEVEVEDETQPEPTQDMSEESLEGVDLEELLKQFGE